MIEYISESYQYDRFKGLLAEETTSLFVIGVEASEEIGFKVYKTIRWEETGIFTVYMKHQRTGFMKICKYYPDTEHIFYMMLNKDDVEEVVNHYVEEYAENE